MSDQEKGRWVSAVDSFRNRGLTEVGSHPEVTSVKPRFTDAEQPVLPVVVFEDFGQPNGEPITIFQPRKPMTTSSKSDRLKY